MSNTQTTTERLAERLKKLKLSPKTKLFLRISGPHIGVYAATPSRRKKEKWLTWITKTEAAELEGIL